MELTAKKLRSVLDYNPSTGIFRWKVAYTRKVGTVAGYINDNGYRVICIFSKDYRASNLAFLWMVGKLPIVDVDHKNRKKFDDRWKNLRLATRSQNMANSKYDDSRKVKKAPKGVCWDSYHQKFRAGIMINYKRIHLGFFDTPSRAQDAYITAAQKYFGEFARS